jgi:hypothetical protein
MAVTVCSQGQTSYSTDVQSGTDSLQYGCAVRDRQLTVQMCSQGQTAYSPDVQSGTDSLQSRCTVRARQLTVQITTLVMCHTL